MDINPFENMKQAKASARQDAQRGDLPGAVGQNPRTDWTLSKALRDRWGGNYAGFMSWAKAQLECGCSWLQPSGLEPRGYLPDKQ